MSANKSTRSQRETMLARWASKLNERDQILEFLRWLETKSIFLAQPLRQGGLVQVNRRFSELLSEYHGIDEAKLDRERRALVGQQLVMPARRIVRAHKIKGGRS